MEIFLNNDWNPSDLRDASISAHDDVSLDTRTFSRVTKSQLNSSKAIDKTLKNALNHRSQCLPYSKANKSQNTLGFSQVKKIRDETALESTNILTMKFWNSFQKHAITYSSDNNSVTSSSEKSIPVVELQTAIKSLSERELAAEVQSIVQSLGLRPTESLTWKEYKDICSRLFIKPEVQNAVIRPTSCSVMNDSISSYKSGDGYSRSASFQSFDESTSANLSQSSSDNNVLNKSETYSMLQRKHRGAGSLKPLHANLNVTDFSPAESTILAPVRKDALCEVLKNEYRKIRQQKLPEHDRRIQDNQPSYLKDIQKNKIAAIRDKNCLIPLKWKKVNEKRALREESIENFNRRKEMMQSFKTVIIAQERNSINKEVINKEQDYISKIEGNAAKRMIENEITARNIETWRNNEKTIRGETRAKYMDSLQKSVEVSKQMIQEEKEFRKFILNEGTDKIQKKLSSCTSSKFEVPQDIVERMKKSRHVRSKFEQAKEDAKHAYEKEMSYRIQLYTSTRQQSIKQAEDYGCGISLNPLRGEDYFYDDGSTLPFTQPVSISSHSARQYFDSASSLSYPGRGLSSSFNLSCPPVYLDPNHSVGHSPPGNMSEVLYDKHHYLRSANNHVKNTDVADLIKRYDDDDENDDEINDNVSITDSIASNN